MAFTVYNECLRVFVQLEEVETCFAMRAQAPGPCYGGSSCPGFIFTGTMISLYLAFVAAISQLVSEELGEVLEEGNDASDKTATKQTAQDVGILVRIDRLDNNGVIKVVKHSYRLEHPNQE
ncbi:hypothetical protein F4814DRAFT_447637 [Daldinia grandis]|nr:hypothetical protein F4814DRAFT_447637 [Daldinia grandis]